MIGLCHCRTGIAYQLPNTKSDKANLAILQLTGNLPFSTEIALMGGQSDEQRTIREPVTMCANCGTQGSDSQAEADSKADRLDALAGVH